MNSTGHFSLRKMITKMVLLKNLILKLKKIILCFGLKI